ncbi:hypothetical protein MASR2M66_22990 [Chloroflexota bacterium]
MSAEQEIITLRVRLKELEDRLDFLYKRLGVEYSENFGAADPRIIALIKQGSKIEAIKIYREMTNTGLAEAKEAVERIASTLL